jgi:hypothetical protein
LRRLEQAVFRRLETFASAVNEDVMARVQTRFFREPSATPPG